MNYAGFVSGLRASLLLCASARRDEPREEALLPPSLKRSGKVLISASLFHGRHGVIFSLFFSGT
jgi:hypothetical protein